MTVFERLEKDKQ